MSEESDNDSDTSVSISDISIEPEQDELSSDLTTDLVDEYNQFIYDDDLSKLVCIGSNFDDIPSSIIHEYSLKTKILDLSGNHFRSLSDIENFPNLEELIIDDNQLDDIHTHFPKLSNLRTLMINKNHLQDLFNLVDHLRLAYPVLTHLSLLGNEACPYGITSTNQMSSDAERSTVTQYRLDEEYQRYRHLLIFRIPTLKFLDSREISAVERRISMQLGDILYSIAEIKKQNNYKQQAMKEKQNEL